MALFTGWGLASALVLLRLADTPVLPRGDSWEYGPQGERLVTLFHLRNVGEWGLGTVFSAIDRDFPPLLHVITAGGGAVVGHEAERIALLGPIWLLLLAVAVAASARGLGLSRSAAGVAGGLTALIPSLHGAACVYWFDLPLTALLWAAFAIGVGTWGRWPIRGGIAVGIALIACCLLKWTGLPFGVAVVIAALIATRRWRAAAVATAVLVVGLLAAYGGDLTDTSFDRMGRTMAGNEEEAGAGALAGIGAMIAGSFRRLVSGGLVRWAWYPVVFVTANLSVALAALTIPAAALGLRGRREVWLPLAGLAAAQLAFLLAMVPVLDERFVMGLAPVVPIGVAALLERQWDRRVLGAVVGLSVLVGLDMHVGPRAAWNHEVALFPNSGDGVSLRGLGVASSFEQLGWARRDEQAPSFSRQRAEIWQAIREHADQGFAVERGAPLLHADDDHPWLRYEALADEIVRGRRAIRFDAVVSVDDVPPGWILLRRASAVPPGWSEVARIDGSPAIVLLERR